MGQDGAKQVWEFPTPVPPYLFIYLFIYYGMRTDINKQNKVQGWDRVTHTSSKVLIEILLKFPSLATCDPHHTIFPFKKKGIEWWHPSLPTISSGYQGFYFIFAPHYSSIIGPTLIPFIHTLFITFTSLGLPVMVKPRQSSSVDQPSKKGNSSS